MKQYENTPVSNTFEGEPHSSFFEKKNRQLPKTFQEPKEADGDFAGEPTPMDPFHDDEVKSHQRDVENFMKRLVSPEAVPDDIPSGVADMIELNMLHSFATLGVSNYQGYLDALAHAQSYDDETIATMERAARSEASADEILSLIVNGVLKKGELGKVTHPYGYRLANVPELRSRVDSAILNNGGILIPRVAPYRDIKLHPHYTFDDKNYQNDLQLNSRLHGLVVTYKRDVGHIDSEETRSVNVVERQTAAIRIDEASGFDQAIAHELLAFRPSNDKQWRDKLVSASGCLDYIETAIQTDSSADYLIPLSTVAYSYESKHQAPTETQRALRRIGAQGVGGAMVYVGPDMH